MEGIIIIIHVYNDILTYTNIKTLTTSSVSPYFVTWLVSCEGYTLTLSLIYYIKIIKIITITVLYKSYKIINIFEIITHHSKLLFLIFFNIDPSGVRTRVLKCMKFILLKYLISRKNKKNALYLKVDSHQLASENFQKFVYCIVQKKYVTYSLYNVEVF